MDVVTTLPRQALTRDDLAALVPEEPDDGHRYELIDGALVVTPSPGFHHQLLLGRLFTTLTTVAPEGTTVLVAPFAVGLGVDTEVQPDLLVAPTDAFTAKDLPGVPLLAVEILSPSTRLIDLHLKKARYEEAGCPSYWVVDPLDVRLIAWELVDGRYVEIADTTDTFTAERPFPVTVVLAELAT